MSSVSVNLIFYFFYRFNSDNPNFTGVVNAIFDGACLVNLLHDLPSRPSMDDLGDMFQTYFERRYPAARIAIEGSSQFSRLFHDQVGGSCHSFAAWTHVS